jgi:hypothetical protein
MKFSQFISFAIIALILVSSSVDSRRYRRVRTKQSALDLLKNFGLGFIVALAGGNGPEVNQCLPESWKSDTLANDATGTSAVQRMTASNSALNTVVNVLKYVVMAVCAVYSSRELLTKLWTKLFGRRRRRFISHRKGWWGDAWNKTKEVVGGVIDKVKNTVEVVVNGVKTVIEVFTNWEKFQEVFQQIKDTIANIKAFFQGKAFQDFMTTLKACAMTLIALALNVKGIVQAVLAITSTAGVALVPMIVGAVCAWEKFIMAVDYFVKGVQTSGTERWYQWGKALGQLLVLFGSVLGGAAAKRRRFRRRFR